MRARCRINTIFFILFFYEQIFAEHEITIEGLKAIDKETIVHLFPLIGHRLNFIRHLQNKFGKSTIEGNLENEVSHSESVDVSILCDI